MGCRCGGCTGRSTTADAPTSGDQPIEVGARVAGDGGEVAGCPGPGARLSDLADRITSGDLGGAVGAVTAGSFRSVRCVPLWAWALVGVALWRS